MNELLPIASSDELRDQAKRLGRRHRRGLAGMVIDGGAPDPVRPSA